MGMENTEREEPMEIFEATEETVEETTQEKIEEKAEEKSQKRQKKEKARKNRRGIRTVLRLVQHAALAVMVFSVIVMAACYTVRVEGVHSNGSYISFNGYSDPGTRFEDSELFDAIFGYAVADVVRFGVVRSQMETNEAFDGSKIVDVTAYNYRNDVLPDQYVTANYRLEDLLKWNNYGFEYIQKEMTEAEAAAFLAGTTQVTTNDLPSGYRNTQSVGTIAQWDEDSGFVAGYQPIGELAAHEKPQTEVTDSEVVVTYRDADEPVYAYDVLVNRYKTAEGKNLEEYVSDWTQYYELCDNLRNAAASLAYNYTDYVEYEDYFNVENSNVRYLIEKTVGEETQYYSNMENGSSYRNHVVQMMADMAQTKNEPRFLWEKFIYYSPGDMTYLTNTKIAESTVREIMQGYDYAYPENVKIWISVDTSYPAKDAFNQGAMYLPNLWLWVVAAFLSGLLYLVLFVYQTVVTGRMFDESGEKRIRLNAFDELPTEAAALIALGVMFLAAWMLMMVTEIGGIDPTDIDFYREAIHQDWFIAAALLGVFAADVLFTFFFYSLVRRIKARTFWKNSYLRRLCDRLKRFAWKVYDNGGIVIRTWVPYGIFLLFNFLLIAWSVKESLLLIFTVAIDIIVGVLIYKDAKERQGIVEGIETIAGGQVEHQIDTEELHGDNRALANSVNSIGKGIREAVEISMKDERMKADLITNVSHDIKTPLTSIINYVDLLKREQMESEKAQDYIRVLDEKSQRLKQLTDDLVEASKITSGTISLHFERINLTELMSQTIGEFSEKFEQKGLTTVMNVNMRHVVIEADSRRIWRVMENLFNNVFKYAMPGTRVYVTIDQPENEKESIEVTIKNISENPLNCKPEELTERFIRGDESRTTEGSGLGLSIAKNLTIAQKGNFEIRLDGDLFKVYLTFPIAGEEV